MNAKNLNLQKGSIDSNGSTVARVYANDPVKKYAIWETNEGDITCDADNDPLAADPTMTEWVIKVGSLISQRKKFRSQYNSTVAYAYKQCFDGDSVGAIKTLKAAFEVMDTRLTRDRRCKLAFLLGAFCAVIILEAAIVPFYVLNQHGEDFHKLLSALAVSALGGFMSVTSGIYKAKIDAEETFKVNMLYGAARILVAVIAGGVAGLMVDTGVALSFLKEQNANGGFLLACFIAGYSERFVDKTLREIETIG